MIIAHKRDGDGIEQSLLEHLQGTAKMAGEFADAFNNRDYAYQIGMLHDLGKYSDEFQNRIKNNGKKCDHTSAGARVFNENKKLGKLGSYCIAGHHSGLQNCGDITDVGGEGTLNGRLSKTYKIPNYELYKQEISMSNFDWNAIPNIKPLRKYGFSLSFLIRMLYSALVDADFLDTESFMNNRFIDRKVEYNFTSFHNKLNIVLNSFTGKGFINQKRAEILENCIKKAKEERGLFTLTVPTGGGKTLSSMAFAINHLLRNNMDRIIYVIPYTSIIEQNAKVFKDIFGKESVLEHHSNYDFKDDDSLDNKLRLSTENWDVPIVVTTNVQFFESLFANKSSRCRKLHNITNSIIIFDEAQMFPTEYLTPCIMAIAELVHNYNSTAVLCSATQPAILEKFPKEIVSKEICENTEELYETFKRTRIINRGQIDSNDLVMEMNEMKQCLCIVNTRKHALKLFGLLKGEGNYHLSTLMCPEHRKAILKEIKQRLNNGQTCKVVSTRLIEAGVDVDFPRVYRSISGLDSIIQAAGRCNREGKLMNEKGEKILGEVHVFEPDEDFSKRQPICFKREIDVTNQIMKQYDDISSPEAIKDYFTRLYQYNSEVGLDIKAIYKSLETGFSNGKFEYDFQTIAQQFRLIEENTVPIIIPYDDNACKLIEQLRHAEFCSKIIRSLQSYTVNIYENEYKSLLGEGKLSSVINDIKYGNIMQLTCIEDYDDNTGLKIEEVSGIGIYL